MNKTTATKHIKNEYCAGPNCDCGYGKATARPWKSNLEIDGSFWIMSEEKIVAKVEARKEARENASLIVKAVNEHDKNLATIMGMKTISIEEHNRIFLNREREFMRVKSLAFNREKQLKKRLQIMGEKVKELQTAKRTRINEALLEACREAYDYLGQDRNWNISDLRLKTLKNAINNATQTR